MQKILLIDGGYLRACHARCQFSYNQTQIVQFAKQVAEVESGVDKTIYYDSPGFGGTLRLPISGEDRTFDANDAWLNRLAEEDGFAVRRGNLGFRGWSLKQQYQPPEGGLTDDDFRPIFEQKGVDMRMGLDIAEICEMRSANTIILVSGDTDLIPALKKARRAGILVKTVEFDNEQTHPLHGSLRMHSDYVFGVNLFQNTAHAQH